MFHKQTKEQMLMREINLMTGADDCTAEVPNCPEPDGFVYDRDWRDVMDGKKFDFPFWHTLSPVRLRLVSVHGNFGNTEGLRRTVVCHVDEEGFRLVYGRRQHHRSWKHRSCAPRQWGHHGSRVVR